MIEVTKNNAIDNKQFPYVVRFNSKEQYFTQSALEELQKKINMALVNPKAKRLTKKQIESLEFHIKENDTFGTIATSVNIIAVLSNMSDELKKMVVRQLMHLQHNYKIVKK